MNNPLLKKLGSTVLALLLLFYLGYQVYNSHHSQIQTETAIYATSQESVQVSGIAIRQEKVVTNNASGVVYYTVPNGGQAANGGQIAQIYANAQSAAAQDRSQALDSEIAKLQSISTPGDTYAANPDSLNKQITLQLSNLLENVNTQSYDSLSEKREDFLALVNERQIVTNKAKDFEARINTLKEQRSALASSNTKPTGSVTAPAAGFFIHAADGFETLIDFSEAESLTVDRLKTLQNQKPSVPAGSIGKISAEYNWYYAFAVPESKVSLFRLGDSVSILFPFSSSESVAASVSAVNQSQTGEAAVILESNRMNASLASIRNATAQVQLNEHTGIRVSQKAVHFATVSKTVTDEKKNKKTVKKEVRGVYVMQGNELQFREIVPLYSTDTYVICDASPDASSLMTGSTVKLSDEVVIEGTDLYDGKVVK